ncbi:MAG: hypothetical protein ACC653_09130 [Gammaproteobacteria bacterium]
MLKGIRNISIANSTIAILSLLNFYLPITAEGWKEISVVLIITAGLFLLSGPVLLIRIKPVWYSVRVLCYANALFCVLYFISLIGKGYLFTLPFYTVLFVFFGFYFIGVRGYLSTNDVRAAYGIKIVTD